MLLNQHGRTLSPKSDDRIHQESTELGDSDGCKQYPSDHRMGTFLLHGGSVFFLNKINKGYAAFQAMNMTKRVSIVSIVSKFPAESQEELEKECIKKTT